MELLSVVTKDESGVCKFVTIKYFFEKRHCSHALIESTLQTKTFQTIVQLYFVAFIFPLAIILK